MEKERLERLVAEGKSTTEISRSVGLSMSGTRYWLKKFALSPTKKKGSERSWTDEQLIAACENNFSYASAIRELGLVSVHGSYGTIKKHIRKLGLDTSHFDQSHNKRRPSSWAIPLDEVMIENSTYGRGTLKKRLIKDGSMEYVCAICGIGAMWNGSKLVLILDHINGINNDHRRENLRFVCPNCDTQLPTFKGRNRTVTKKPINLCVDCGTEITRGAKRCRRCAGLMGKDKILWPDGGELEEMLNELSGNVSALGKKLGVSDNAVRKHMKKWSQSIV